MKPALTKEHMEERLKWCESFIKEDGRYKDMLKYIHVDEKWFYLGKVKNIFKCSLRRQNQILPAKTKNVC